MSRPVDDPYLFEVPLQPGTYRAQFGLRARSDTRIAIRSQARRLMMMPFEMAAGDETGISISFEVRTTGLKQPFDNAPVLDSVSIDPDASGGGTWSPRFCLEIFGDVDVSGIEVERSTGRTIYLLGDSTVADQPVPPAASWGQVLPVFFNSDVTIANHAANGETLKSFIASLRLAKVLEAVKPGDILLIQFGHNDQKPYWPHTYLDPEIGYPAYLRVFIAEALARQAHPVLVTSPERRLYGGNGTLIQSHGTYPDAVRAVARADNVPLIDLHAFSRRFYEVLGRRAARSAFNDGGADRTHHSLFGAYALASAVAEDLVVHFPQILPGRTSEPFHDLANPLDPGSLILPETPGAGAGVIRGS